MSKYVEWGIIHGEGEIICNCDQCNHEERIEFEDGYPDFREAQEDLKSEGWVSSKIDGQWYDFCSEQCYYDYIKENK